MEGSQDVRMQWSMKRQLYGLEDNQFIANKLSNRNDNEWIEPLLISRFSGVMVKAVV